MVCGTRGVTSLEAAWLVGYSLLVTPSDTFLYINSMNR